jgi:nucleotide sugar dehydrogenase
MMVEKIAVVGVGKLGLCFALNLERSGFRVWGIERDRAYVQSLTNRTFRSSEPEVDDLLSKAERLTFTDSLECIVNEQITDVFIMVATPSLPDGSYIGCTTMPGYCDRLAADMQGTGLSISYNPEFIAQGTIIRDQLYPDQILIGEASQSAGDRLQYIYSRMVRNSPTYCRMDPLSAEIAKLATNCFLTTKISFANSIGDLAIKAGADPHRILAAIGSDSRIGEKYLRYGYGFGGPCFPRDNRALGLFGQQQGYPLHISHATDNVNEEHLQFQLTEILNGRQPNEEIIIDGVAYKPGTDQLTESQSLRLAVALAEAGRNVLIVDSESVIRSVETMYPRMFRFEVASAPEVK